MTPTGRRRYHDRVAAVRDALRRVAAALALLIGLLQSAPANAASSSFNVADQGVISVVAGAGATITVRGWDRPNVQFDTDDEAVQVERRTIPFGTPQNPLSVAIPATSVAVRDPVTRTTTPGSLPPEEFPYASDFRSGPHDVVRIVVGAQAHITVNVPSSVALLNVRVRGLGNVSITGYHGGTLFVGLQNGHTLLNDVLSAAFVQQMNGNLDVLDSSFDRLRARGNTVDMQFEHDRARQIEVTTISGPIIWDDGTFDPGLARFESTYAPIAIGVAGSAQVAARSNDGHVYSLFERRTPLTQRGDGESDATIGGGGPVVNAVSGRGNIYLYDGAIGARRAALPPQWQPVRQALQPRPGQPQTPLRAPSALERFRALRGGRF